jgi:MFS family permease
MSSFANHLGLPSVRGHVRLVVALLVDALGSGLFLPFTVLFFLATTNLDVTKVGLAVSVGSVVRLVVGPLSGALTDRFGPQPVLVMANLLQGAGFLAYLAVHSFVALVLVTVLVQAGNAAFWSSYPSLVTRMSAPGEREQWFGFLGALRNSGFALGGLAAGAAVSAGGTNGYRLLAVLNAASYAVAALLLVTRRIPRSAAPRPETPPHKLSGPAGWRSVLADRPYLGLSATNTSVATAALALTLVMPVWTVRNLGMPAWVPGVALTVNCVLVALAQGPVVRLLRGCHRVRALQLAAALHVVAAAVLLLAAAPPEIAGIGIVLAGVLVYTAAELLENPVSAALAAEAAPENLRGHYLAVHQTSWNMTSILAPAALTALLAVGGPAVWGTLAAIAVAGAGGITVVARYLPASWVRVGSAPSFT